MALPALSLFAVTGAFTGIWQSVVSVFNGKCSRETQLEIEEKRRVAQLKNSYLNIANQQKMAHENREFQAVENDKSRYLQRELSDKQRQTQLDTTYLNILSQQQLAERSHQTNREIAQENRGFQRVENAKNRYFQHDLEAMRQTFQQQMLEYQLDKNQELQTFIKNVDIAIAKDNREFQTWLFKQQRALQTELAAYNRDIQLEVAAYQRETNRQSAEFNKILDNWPLKLYPSEIIGSFVGTPVPVRVILAPPEMDYDKQGTATKNFPKIEKQLTQGVREFLEQHYSLHSERATEFLGSNWESKRFSGEASIKRLFNLLKSEPTLVVESEVDGEYIHVRVAYWGGGQEIYTYKTVFSQLPHHNIVNKFAEARMAKQGLTGDIQSNAKDFEQFCQFLIACHRLLIGLFTDAHYLIYYNLSPTLPSLLSQVMADFPDHQIAHEMLQWVISGYQEVFNSVAVDRAQWIPDLYLGLATGLTHTNDKSLAKTQFKQSIRHWLAQRGMETPAEDAPIEAWTAAMKPMLVTADHNYVKNLGDCVTGIVF